VIAPAHALMIADSGLYRDDGRRPRSFRPGYQRSHDAPRVPRSLLVPSLCPKMEIKVLVRTPSISLDRRSRPRRAMHGIVLCVCLRPFVHVKLTHCVCPRLLDSDRDLTFPRRSGPWERSRPEPAPATALARARPEKGGGGSGRCEWELAAWGRRRRARKGRC
jgi:hypothetical protein